MFGAFDITFCANRTCPKSDSCGRSVKRLDGQKAIIAISAYNPDETGHCDFEMPYREYQVPEWMTHMAEDHEARYMHEKARLEELIDADSLDADNLDREV